MATTLRSTCPQSEAARAAWDALELDTALDEGIDGAEDKNVRPDGFEVTAGDCFAIAENYAAPDGRVYHILFSSDWDNYHAPWTDTWATLYRVDDPADMVEYSAELARWEAMPDEDPDADWTTDEDADNQCQAGEEQKTVPPGWDSVETDDPSSPPFPGTGAEMDDESDWDFASRVNGDHDRLDGVFLAMLDAQHQGDVSTARRLASVYHDWLTKSGRTMEGYSHAEAMAAVRAILA